MKIGSWNIRAFLVARNLVILNTELVSKELLRYDMDRATLTETGLSGVDHLAESRVGCTFLRVISWARNVSGVLALPFVLS